MSAAKNATNGYTAGRTSYNGAAPAVSKAASASTSASTSSGGGKAPSKNMTAKSDRRWWDKASLVRALEPESLLVAGAVAGAIAWLLLFSWTSLLIQCLTLTCAACLALAGYLTVQRYGLLTFMPRGVRRAFTELSLMDIAQIPWNSQVVTDIATLFIFRLSEAERNNILATLPPHVRSALVTKGLVNLLPPNIQPLVAPHPPTTASPLDVLLPALTHSSSSSSSSTASVSPSDASFGDHSSPLLTYERKRASLDDSPVGSAPSAMPLLTDASSSSGADGKVCPVTRFTSVFSPPAADTSSSGSGSGSAESKVPNVIITHGHGSRGSGTDESAFARQLRLWSLTQLGNKRVHTFIRRMINSRTAQQVRRVMIPSVLGVGPWSVLPNRRSLNILAGTGVFTLAVQYAYSPGTRRWARRWTHWGMEGAMYLTVTVALAAFIATRGFSSRRRSEDDEAVEEPDQSLQQQGAVVPATPVGGLRGAVMSLVRFERRYHKLLLSAVVLTGWLAYLSRAYKARQAAQQLRLLQQPAARLILDA